MTTEYKVIITYSPHGAGRQLRQDPLNGERFNRWPPTGQENLCEDMSGEQRYFRFLETGRHGKWGLTCCIA